MSHDLRFEFRQTTKGGTGVLKAFVNGDAVPFLTRKCDPTLGGVQQELRELVLRKKKGLDPVKVEEAIDCVAAEAIGPQEQEQEKINQGQRIVDLMKGEDLFHSEKIAHATVRVRDRDQNDSHVETYPVKSERFKEWLGSQYQAKYRSTATAAAIADAVNTLSGIANTSRPQRPVAVRMAEYGDSIYIDLSDDTWRVVRVTVEGWSIIKDPPVRFLRKDAMKPLPVPARGGSINDLRPLLNVADDDQWILIVGWLLGALRPAGPYSILAVNGEHGSAKSTCSRMLRRLVDPNRALLRSVPRDVRDLFIQGGNSWVVALDNLSGVPQYLADALSSIATGVAFSTRTLTTNDTETIFEIKRPIILNGIEEDTTKQDLVSRTIQIKLPAIPNEKRKTEKRVWAEFDQAAPGIFGALLDAVSSAMKNLHHVDEENLPRMADSAVWVVAAELGGALPWNRGEFIRALASNRDNASRLALEESPIGPWVQIVVNNCSTGEWRGRMSELLDAVSHHADAATKAKKEWPGNVQRFTAAMWRLAPALREQGIDLSQIDRTNSSRGIVLKRVKNPDAPAHADVAQNLVTPRHASPDELVDLPF